MMIKQIPCKLEKTLLARLQDRNPVGMDHKTVIRYIELLEQSFVIVRLLAFSRNLRTEMKKTRKIYFYDVGIRNALLHNFNPFHLRADGGQVWENFAVIERMKRDAYAGLKKLLFLADS